MAKTAQGFEKSCSIRFNRGLPRGDSLCARLFTLCINPVAWKLKATEGYRLSKPINLLYIDDLKVFAASESKLGCPKVNKISDESYWIGMEFQEVCCHPR